MVALLGLCNSGRIMGTHMVSQDDLIITVYLNQRVVFDLVAMLQGGIASVTHVSYTQRESGTRTAEASGQFGLNKVLSSLLRIDFSGQVSTHETGESGQTRTEERIHTPTSLFITLRALLREKGYITQDVEGMVPVPGQIIEFLASLRHNPLLETLRTFVDLVEITEALSADPSSGKKRRESQLHMIKRQIQSFVQALTTGDTLDLTTGPLRSSYRCVITLEKQYLNDPDMSDLVDGTFRVLGKVTRVIPENQGAISLNRKSALGRLPNSLLADLQARLESPELEGLALPKMEWEIPGPVIQVLPIAIFT